MSAIGHQIFSIPSDLDFNPILPDDEKEKFGDYEESFERFYLRGNMKIIYRFPNFQYGGWECPSGWVANFSPQSPFKQYAFGGEKYDCFTMVKLKLEGSELTPLKLKDIQHKTSLFLPRKNISPPDPESRHGDGWGVSLERGGFIMIAKTKVKDDNELKEFYYVIAYTQLPREFLDLQQERESKLKSCTFEKEFLSHEGAYQARGQKIGQEMGKRILTDWSRIVGVTLDVDEVSGETDEEEFTLPNQTAPPPQFLEPSLELFKGGFIRPYSIIPDGGEIPKNLHFYEIGRALGVLKKDKPSVFLELQKKYQFRYAADIVTFTPDCQTTVNGFNVTGVNQLTWYSNCCPMEGAFLSFKGYQEGFDCYNYNPLKRAPFEDSFHQRNNYMNSFPCVFPFRQHFKEASKETILKFCSPGFGGYLYPHKQPPPLGGEFLNAFNPAPFNPPSEKISLEPVFVFLAGGYLNMPNFGK